MSRHGSRAWRGVGTTLAALLLCGSAACDKQDKIVVQNITPTAANQPPIIVASGPQVPANGFGQVGYFPSGIDLWVLAGDPNGLNDISLVTMDIDSVRLVRFIVRPDTSRSGCIHYGYGPGDTLAATSILPVPKVFPGVRFRPLTRAQGGLFEATGLGDEIGFPDIMNASPVLERWNGGCGGDYAVYGPFYVNPPAVPSRRVASISYIELEYYGIKVTVYDTVGASASVTYPTLKLTLKIPDEPTPLP